MTGKNPCVLKTACVRRLVCVCDILGLYAAASDGLSGRFAESPTSCDVGYNYITVSDGNCGNCFSYRDADNIKTHVSSRKLMRPKRII
jgi:hypothetical protein